MGSLFDHPWWLLVSAAIGILAVFSILISLFTSLGRRPKNVCATDLPSVDSREFLHTLAGLVNGPLERGGQAVLLNNGDAFFPEILAAIRGAKKNVNFATYIWEPGRASDLVFEALIERARAGVEVRLLLDGLGGIRAPADDVKRLIAAGGKVNEFRTAAFGKLLRFHKRNHRRAIVIDGRVGFTGGAAVGDKWLGNAQDPRHWRDSMVKVTGSLATNLQSAFAEPWAYICGEMLTGCDFFPKHDDHDGNPIQHINLVSSPASEEHPLRLFFLLSFMAARKQLYIASSYFVPEEQLRDVVAERARSGVDVRILVPNEHTDAKPIRLAGRSYYDELLSAGVRIFEYQPTMMHCKNTVIDGAWSIVGTANMDIRSKELNQENVIGILDTGFAAQVQEAFLADLEQSQEITLATWRQRGVWERFKERFWVTFAEQF